MASLYAVLASAPTSGVPVASLGVHRKYSFQRCAGYSAPRSRDVICSGGERLGVIFVDCMRYLLNLTYSKLRSQ
jgi:hypothetical protein